MYRGEKLLRKIRTVEMEVAMALKEWDKNGSGSIDFMEFVAMVAEVREGRGGTGTTKLPNFPKL